MQADAQQQSKVTPAERRARPRRRADRIAAARSNPEFAAELVEKSFARLAPQAEELGARFYARLFEDYPEVRPLFEGTDPGEQQKKLLAALKLLVANLRNGEKLSQVLTELGARHQDYGARPEHYPAVATTLLGVMAEMTGKAWAPEVQVAWEQTFNTVAH